MDHHRPPTRTHDAGSEVSDTVHNISVIACGWPISDLLLLLVLLGDRNADDIYRYTLRP